MSAKGAAKCTKCAPGTYCEAGSMEAAPCEKGWFSPQPDKPCAGCEMGKYSEARGSAECASCKKDTFSTVPFSSSRSDCVSCSRKADAAVFGETAGAHSDAGESSYCAGGSVRLVKAGNWRAPGNVSEVTYRCVHPKRCLGVTKEEEKAYEQVAWEDLAATMTTGNSSGVLALNLGMRRRLQAGAPGVNLTFRPFECSEGATGRLCGLCKRGYVSAGKNGCRVCAPADVAAQLYVFMSALSSLVIFFSVRSMTSDSGDNAFDDDGDGVDFDEMASSGNAPPLAPA